MITIKSIVKIVLEIALGFVVFSFVCLMLALLGYFAVDFIESVSLNDTLVMSIGGLLFIIACWKMGSDVLQAIKSRFKKCD